MRENSKGVGVSYITYLLRRVMFHCCTRCLHNYGTTDLSLVPRPSHPSVCKQETLG